MTEKRAAHENLHQAALNIIGADWATTDAEREVMLRALHMQCEARLEDKIPEEHRVDILRDLVRAAIMVVRKTDGMLAWEVVGLVNSQPEGEEGLQKYLRELGSDEEWVCYSFDGDDRYVATAEKFAAGVAAARQRPFRPIAMLVELGLGMEMPSTLRDPYEVWRVGGPEDEEASPEEPAVEEAPAEEPEADDTPSPDEEEEAVEVAAAADDETADGDDDDDDGTGSAEDE